MKTLRIDSSIRKELSKTRLLADYFESVTTENTHAHYIRRDVGLNPPDFPSEKYTIANYTLPEERTPEMIEVLKSSDILINELIDASKIIIASPMYNFTISSTLKTYIDNIVRIGRTFHIDENGDLLGLLKEKKMLVITTRGAMSYVKGGNLENFDFQENYLRAIFGFIGITDITFVNVEGLDFGDEMLQRNALNEAKEKLKVIAKTW